MIALRSWHKYLITALAVLLPTVMRAQAPVTTSDLVGTWEEVAIRNLKTGAVDTVVKHGVNWVQFTRSHWMIIEMEKSRKVVPPAEFAKLSPADQQKANYAMVWDDNNNQIFAARGGTYRLDENTLHTTRLMALYSAFVGREEVFTMVRVDQNTLLLRSAPDDQGVAVEVTLRRID